MTWQQAMQNTVNKKCFLYEILIIIFGSSNIHLLQQTGDHPGFTSLPPSLHVILEFGSTEK